MPKLLSFDLRSRVLAAIMMGVCVVKLHRRFGVSVSVRIVDYTVISISDQVFERNDGTEVSTSK